MDKPTFKVIGYQAAFSLPEATHFRIWIQYPGPPRNFRSDSLEMADEALTFLREQDSQFGGPGGFVSIWRTPGESVQWKDLRVDTSSDDEKDIQQETWVSPQPDERVTQYRVEFSGQEFELLRVAEKEIWFLWKT